MDSYYEEWWTTCRRNRLSLPEFRGGFQPSATSTGGGNGDDVIDRIRKHIMEGIIKEGLLEEELVS